MSNSSLRVGLSLLSVYPSNNAGTTTYVRGLLSGLAEDQTVEVVALANREIARACEALVHHRTIVRGSRRYDTAERKFGRVPALGMTALLPLVTAGGLKETDVIHYPQTVRSPRVDRPVVVTLHDVQHLDLPHLFSTPVRIWRRLTYDESARRADAVITVSDHARARIVDRLGIDPSRVHVSHHGVDSIFTPEPSANDAGIRRDLGLREPYLYYPASLAPHKNHSALFRALSLLDDRPLVLTGPYTDGRLEELLKEAAAWGVGERVKHLGLVVPESLPALYRGASCLVFPSLYEGFGVPIVEAMASGCPVACSDRGAPVEVAGGAALTFEAERPEAIADAVQKLDDPALRGHYVTEGLRRAGQFTWRNVARQHRQVYELAAH